MLSLGPWSAWTALFVPEDWRPMTLWMKGFLGGVFVSFCVVIILFVVLFGGAL